MWGLVLNRSRDIVRQVSARFIAGLPAPRSHFSSIGQAFGKGSRSHLHPQPQARSILR
jgi:predicted membrane chloride channel (bestrophin family)